MATRGTGYLLMEKKVVCTTEFNGDMYPEGHGDYFFTTIAESVEEIEFRTKVSYFNNRHFGYDQTELFHEIENLSFYDVLTREKLIIDFTNKYFERFFSDWVFFKNLTGFPVLFLTRGETIQEVEVKHGDSIRFNYGELTPLC